MTLTLQELGEQGLLQRLQAFCPSEIVGDDAAIVTVTPGKRLVVTTDLLVDHVHFSDRTTSPVDVGWRAAAANLSDLAAMGATPLGITVGLALPSTTSVAWVEALYQGLVDCLQSYQVPIVGGDVCRSSVTTIAITAYGEVQPDRVIYRSTAQAGDIILVTGVHGASRAGLELLLHPEQSQSLSIEEQTKFKQAHQRPVPRLDLVPSIGTSLAETGSEFWVAGMDSSDGLADAVLQLCRQSGVGARLERSQLPIPPGLHAWVGIDKAVEWTLYGGEDYELVLCLPPAPAQWLLNTLPGSIASVGVITASLGVLLVDSSGQYPTIELSLDRGFQHFS
jgi:thiamine-monophosphate kinase